MSRSTNKSLRLFEEAVQARGAKIERGGKHYKIMLNGRQVGILAGTGEANAYRQAMRDLRRQGIVGDTECRIKF